jgi:hypothetical protein
MINRIQQSRMVEILVTNSLSGRKIPEKNYTYVLLLSFYVAVKVDKFRLITMKYNYRCLALNLVLL